MGLLDEVLSVVIVIFVIVIGIVVMQALYPVSPLGAVLGTVLLIAVAIYVILRLISDLSD